MCQISSKSFESRLRYVSFNIMLVFLGNAYSRPLFVFFLNMMGVNISNLSSL